MVMSNQKGKVEEERALNKNRHKTSDITKEQQLSDEEKRAIQNDLKSGSHAHDDDKLLRNKSHQPQ